MEHLPDFRLHRPATVAEAVALRAEETEARYLAGGTDMVVNIRRGIEQPATLVDLNAIEGFAAIEENAGGLVIGAGATLDMLAAREAVRRDYTAVAEAAGAVAGPTHRRYGTIGGNLCLDTRCLYYNQSEWWRRANAYCLKNVGETCHVAPGGKRCFAAFSGDLAPAMLVHDAEVEIAGADGTRRIPLAGLYRDDGMDHLTLAPGELLTAIHLPKSTAGVPSGYAKSRIRGAIDFPLAGVAILLDRKDGRIASLRIALTGVNPSPRLVEAADDLTGKPLDADTLDEVREMVRKTAKPMRTTTVPPWYRRRVVGALARRLAARLANP
jgi:4-hydroxybenzoyl-CoA reductase subunit beta